MENEQVRIAIRLDDGTIAVMNFLTLGRGNILPNGAEWADERAGWWKREPNDQNVFTEIERTFVNGPKATAYRRIRDGDLPSDRSYRGAWVDDGKAITHDMAKARNIHRDKLRRARVALFAENDIEVTAAVLDGDQARLAKAKARRRQLQDAPADPRIEAAQTIDELKSIVIA